MRIGNIVLALVCPALAACATPEYMSPEVSDAELQRVAAARSDQAKKVKRDRVEAARIVTAAEMRLRPAIRDLCENVSGKNCDFDISIENDDDTPNAYASGENKIVITTAMLEYLESEDEVAFVLAHEIGHHMANHINEGKRNMTVGALVGGALLGALAAAGSRDSYNRSRNIAKATQLGATVGAVGGRLSYSKAQEREADYLGIYAIELAGYDPTAAARVMDRFTQINPRSARPTSFFGTHPSSIEREARALKVKREIEEKRDAGLPMIPNRVAKDN
ncbi:MAG: M48 family metallopeptidase [Alphaproteobacteria bacterium]